MSLKVTFIANSFDLGGAELQLLRLLAHRPSDIRVEVIVLAAGSLDHRLAALDVKLTIVPRLGKSMPIFLQELSRELLGQRSAVVHTWTDGTSGTAGRLAALMAGHRRIIHSDRSVIDHPRLTTRLQRLLRPQLDRLTSLFLPNSVSTAEALRTRGIPAGRIHYLPNGLELTKFKVKQQNMAPLTLGFLGKFRIEKRPELLLEALQLVPERGRPARVSMGGDGPLMSEVQRRVEGDAWLSGHVNLPGLIEDVPEFLSTLDYLVLCSDFEGTPNAVLEAMASGLPVIATDVASLPRMLAGCGETVPRGDAQALAVAIARMEQRSQSQRAALGVAARAYVQEHHDLQSNAAVFWDLHRQVAKGKVTV